VTESALEIRVRRLESDDDRTVFCSGDIDLDRFFQRFAGQKQFRHHIGTTYVAVLGERIVGYATVSAGEMSAESLPPLLRRRLPSYPLPVMRLARLAVDKSFQGRGIGKLLLRAMLILALEIRDRVGCVGVVVDSKPWPVDFYQKLGFTALEVVSGMLGDRPEPRTMFLPISHVAAAASRR
jgi:GNAT superfamily N-acetyltransferase